MNRRTSKNLALPLAMGLSLSLTCSLALADLSGSVQKADKAASDAKQTTSTVKEQVDQYSSVTKTDPNSGEKSTTEVKETEKKTTQQAGEASQSADEQVQKSKEDAKKSADDANKKLKSSMSSMDEMTSNP